MSDMATGMIEEDEEVRDWQGKTGVDFRQWDSKCPAGHQLAIMVV